MCLNHFVREIQSSLASFCVLRNQEGGYVVYFCWRVSLIRLEGVLSLHAPGESEDNVSANQRPVLWPQWPIRGQDRWSPAPVIPYQSTIITNELHQETGKHSPPPGLGEGSPVANQRTVGRVFSQSEGIVTSPYNPQHTTPPIHLNHL